MKALHKINRKYYKYIEDVVPFVQIVPSSTQTGGNQIACSGGDAKIYNPDNGSYIGNINVQNIYYVPKGLKASSVFVRYDGGAHSPTGYVECSNDGVNWVNRHDWNEWTVNHTIQLDDDTFYKYHKVVGTGVSVGSHITNWLYSIVYTGDTYGQVVVESDVTDYDFYQDYHVYNSAKNTNRHYYKIIPLEVDFVTPKLSSNGTLGGNSFACGGTYAHTSYGTNNIYQLFDGNTSTGITAIAYNGGTYITFYNPKPIKVTSIRNDHIWYAGDWRDVTIYGSNDNSTWTDLGYFNHGLTTACDISNPQYFKYYKLYNNSGFGADGSGYGGGLTELYITAKIDGSYSIETDETNYDYYVDTIKYMA